MTDQAWVTEIVRQCFDATSPSVDASPPGAERVKRLLVMVRDGHFREAYWGMRHEKSLDKAQKKMILKEVNETYLFERELEWTNHGILRSFRFWATGEKVKYLRVTHQVMDALRIITPHVSLGFGSVLAVMREGDFIPHDDDMDILIAFETAQAHTFADALDLVKVALTADGYRAHGDYLSHFNVTKDGGKAVDVFVGFIEDDRVSWFPSQRRNLLKSQVFPTRSAEMLGVECDIPARPEEYLAATYGEDWREPIANWNHPWDRSQYQDFVSD